MLFPINNCNVVNVIFFVGKQSKRSKVLVTVMKITMSSLNYVLPQLLNGNEVTVTSGEVTKPTYEKCLSIFHGYRICITYCAGIFKQSMGARNRVGNGLSYRPAGLEHRLADSIPGN